MSDVLPDPVSELGRWVRERLRDDPIAWLTTVDGEAVAQPNTVWFLWEDPTILVYNVADAHRLAHIRRRPTVTLLLEAYGRDGDSIVVVCDARLDPDAPPADRNEAFMRKYSARVTGAWARWASRFPIALRLTPLSFRGFHAAGR